MGDPTLIHTLVLHLFPDLEALCMAWLCQYFGPVRTALGIAKDPVLKFIPSGALRPEDWPDQRTDVAGLTRQGFLFLDCGGGYFDQHVYPGEPDTSSLDRLAAETQLLGYEPYLTSLVRVISANDTRATGIVRDVHFRAHGSTSTVPHLRNLIMGWNLLCPDNPAQVYQLASLAFHGLLANLIKLAEERHGRGLDDREIAMRALNLFMLPSIRTGLKIYLREQCDEEGAELRPPPDVTLQQWESTAARALAGLEAEWNLAEYDFRHRGELKQVSVNGAVLKVAIVTSGSSRFGPWARYTLKPQLILQFQPNGKFTISSHKHSLEKVARAIWQAELERWNMTTSSALEAVIRGEQPPTGPPSHPSRWFYLFVSKTLFGNFFRSNPYMPQCKLIPDEIISLTLRSL